MCLDGKIVKKNSEQTVPDLILIILKISGACKTRAINAGDYIELYRCDCSFWIVVISISKV